MNCAICKTRKARRHCPGINGDICTICCGTEREQSIDCPLECTYLQQAHEHERLAEIDPSTLPNQDLEADEDFLRANEVLMAFLAITLYEGAVKYPAATDWDLRETFEALVKTWRTLQSGLYYESLPTNVFAAGIAAHMKATIDEIKQKEVEAGGPVTLLDRDILRVLAFLQRLEYLHNNGRKRSRAFLDFLRGFYIPSQDIGADGDALAPDEPRVIL